MNVEVTECPDLTKAPFHLAAPHLSGSTTVIEFGGVPYLLPLVDLTKVYDIKLMLDKIAEEHKHKGYFAVGAGAGPHTLHKQNCEVEFNEISMKITHKLHKFFRECTI